jgi:cell division protein FtsL
MTATEILSVVLIIVILLAGIIPMVMGIIYYTKENRRLDREEKNARKAASHQ